MDEKERKRLERAERKRQRERERYAKSKAAGLSRKEAKSIKKTLTDKPELAKSLEDISPAIARGVENLSDLVKTFTGEQPKKRRKQPKVQFTQKKTLTAAQRKANKEAGAFKRFLGLNPGLSARQAKEQFRSWGKGHSIGSARADAIYREKMGLPLQESKSTKFPTYGYENNPTGYQYSQARYIYMMEYTVLVSGLDQDEVRHMSIGTDVLLSKREREARVLAAYDSGELDQSEYYAGIYIYEDSIRTLYLIDTHKRSKAFQKFEAQEKAAHPEYKPYQILKLWRDKKGLS